MTKGVTKEEFAVIQTGGKQYKVSKGGVLAIEKMKPARADGGEYKKGDKISFDKVLLVDDGQDTAEIVEIGRARKILVVKYKQKSLPAPQRPPPAIFQSKNYFNQIILPLAELLSIF